jgi:hypothetical protein
MLKNSSLFITYFRRDNTYLFTNLKYHRFNFFGQYTTYKEMHIKCGNYMSPANVVLSCTMKERGLDYLEIRPRKLRMNFLITKI